jgi:uncharacterized protein YuzE
MTTQPILYDAATDSMYVTLREGPAVHTIVHDDRDYAVDIGADGEPIGYDIQFASRHPEVIAEALRLLKQDTSRNMVSNILFKFIKKIEFLPDILSGIVKFSKAEELNDPSELIPNVMREKIVKSLETLRRYGYSETGMEGLIRQGNLLRKLAPRFMRNSPPLTIEYANQTIRSDFFNYMPALETLLNETADSISQNVGIFCLSQCNDSLPMWAHYAKNAAGFVVEYRDLNDTFIGDDTGILNRLMPVRYEKDTTGVTFYPDSQETLFFTKLPDWSYEKEVRVILQLSSCDTRQNGANKIYYKNLDKKHVSSIICGWKMSPGEIETVRQAAENINPQVKIVHAEIVRGQIRVT